MFNKFSYVGHIMAIRIALATGMRRSEVLDLTWKCVDFERSTVTVRKGDTLGNDTISRNITATVLAGFQNFVFGSDLLDRLESHQLFADEHGKDGHHDNPAEQRGAEIKSGRQQGNEPDHGKRQNHLKCIFHFIPASLSLLQGCCFE